MGSSGVQVPQGGRQVPPAATHPQYAAWEAVGADVGEWVVPESRTKIKFVVFVDLATKLRVAKPLQTYKLLEMKAESTKDIVTAFCECWLACFRNPKRFCWTRRRTCHRRQCMILPPASI